LREIADGVVAEAYAAAARPPALHGGLRGSGRGCDSELGSSLHWTRLREIADGVVAEAYAAAEISPEAR